MSETDLKEKEQKAAKVDGSHESIEGGIAPSEQAELDQIEAGLKESDTNSGFISKIKSLKGKTTSRAKKIIGITVGGLIISAIVAIFSLLLPVLRLEGYMQRINERAFAAASSVIEARMGHLLERYMVSYLTELDSCRTVRSIDCKVDYRNKGIATRLYRQWRDVRIEARLFDNYGLTVETSQENGVPKHTLKDRRGQQIDLSRDPDGTFRNIVSDDGRRQTGRELRRFLRAESKWYQVMERKSIRNYLERKHGLRTNCFFACKKRDDAERTRRSALTRFKQRFVGSLVEPFSSHWGFALNCMIEGSPGTGSCSNSERRKATNESLSRRGNISDETLDAVQRGELRSVSQVVVREIAQKINSELLEKLAVSGIPVIGWVYAALSAMDIADRLDVFIDDNGLTQIAAGINSAQYLKYYAEIRTANDELKAGALTAEEVGVLVGQFEGAEDSLVNKAYAGHSAHESDPEYVCRNGEPIPEGNYVCEEKKVNRSFTLQEIRDDPEVGGLIEQGLGVYRNCAIPGTGGLVQIPEVKFESRSICALPGIKLKTWVRPVLNTINKVADAVSSTVIGIFTDYILTDSFVAYLEEKGEQFTNWLMGGLFPLPVGEDSPGREKYDGLEAGADVASNEFVQGGYDNDTGEPYGLGGTPIDDNEVARYIEDQKAQREYEIAQSSIFKRYTDLENSSSLASGIVMSDFAGKLDSSTSFASSFVSSFTSLFNGGLFANFLKPSYAQANTQQQAINAFGVQRYGYDQSYTTVDPETYTEEYCQQAKEDWEESMILDEETGFEIYEEANPCLLEEVIVEAGSEYFIYE